MLPLENEDEDEDISVPENTSGSRGQPRQSRMTAKAATGRVIEHRGAVQDARGTRREAFQVLRPSSKHMQTLYRTGHHDSARIADQVPPQPVDHTPSGEMTFLRDTVEHLCTKGTRSCTAFGQTRTVACFSLFSPCALCSPTSWSDFFSCLLPLPHTPLSLHR